MYVFVCVNYFSFVYGLARYNSGGIVSVRAFVSSYFFSGFPGGLVVKKKKSVANARDARDAGLITGLGRFPGGGHGNPLQYPCLENSMNRGAWRTAVHGIVKS